MTCTVKSFHSSHDRSNILSLTSSSTKSPDSTSISLVTTSSKVVNADTSSNVVNVGTNFSFLSMLSK